MTEFDDLIAQQPFNELGHWLKSEILKRVPDATELVWPKQNIASYGFGPKKMSEHFVYIGFFKQHVNLEFYYGADLPDQKGLLQGTGKKLRHIKLVDLKEAKAQAIWRLVDSAIQERRSFLGL